MALSGRAWPRCKLATLQIARLQVAHLALDRDVLGLSGLTHVIWLEGINDLGAGYGQAATAAPVFENPVVHTPANIIAGYQNVVGRLHAKGVKVYGATIVSALPKCRSSPPVSSFGIKPAS